MQVAFSLLLVLWIFLAFTVFKSVFLIIGGIIISIIWTAFFIYSIKTSAFIIKDKNTNEEHVKGSITNIVLPLLTPVMYEGFWGYRVCMEIFIENEKYYLPRSVMKYIQVGSTVSIIFKPLSKVILSIEIDNV